MRRALEILAFTLISLLVLWLVSAVARPGYTRLALTDAETGRKILVAVLRDGEPVVLTWHNSIFDLDVTEEFIVERGRLIQTSVTFADPRGVPPMPASPQDLDDLYHTGGAFAVRGLAKPFERIVYRVGEIGKPKLRVRERVVEFEPAVGFGGRIVLTAQAANLSDWLIASSQ